MTVDALFNQAGVIRTDTLAEMFDVAALLAEQPVPAGDRVAIVTNAGGPGIVCADACIAAGVQVPEPSVDLAAKLAARLPDTASIANPIDMIATASAEDYRQTLATVAGSGEFDAILAIFVPPLVTEATDVAAAISEVAATTDGCPIAAVFMTAEGPPPQLAAGDTTRARLSVSRRGSASGRSGRAVRQVEISPRGGDTDSGPAERRARRGDHQPRAGRGGLDVTSTPSSSCSSATAYRRCAARFERMATAPSTRPASLGCRWR